jgi:hypothetical protein
MVGYFGNFKDISLTSEEPKRVGARESSGSEQVAWRF